MALNVVPIRTGIFSAGENLLEFVVKELGKELGRELSQGRTQFQRRVLAVTSKIVSLAEGRLVDATVPKAALVKAEAERVLGWSKYGTPLTIKHGVMVPAAGIDESNSVTGQYILYPEDPWQSAAALGKGLRSALGHDDVGVLITDSRTLPLRRGTVGFALSHWGFEGVRDERGKSDLFGRQLKLTQIDLVDALAAAAVLEMGEAAESCPLAVIDYGGVVFNDGSKSGPGEVNIPPEDDLFFELYKTAPLK